MTERWSCKTCGAEVEMHFNHVGSKCDGESDEDDCSGTFQHRPYGSKSCPLKRSDLTHEQVETRALSGRPLSGAV